MSGMTETEGRLITCGARYMASHGALSTREMDGRDVPGTFETDARDAYYMARDLTEPDHEHVWIYDQVLCEPTPRVWCARCGRTRVEA